MLSKNSFATAAVLSVNGKDYRYFSLRALEAAGKTKLANLPYSIRIVLENLLGTKTISPSRPPTSSMSPTGTSTPPPRKSP